MPKLKIDMANLSHGERAMLLLTAIVRQTGPHSVTTKEIEELESGGLLVHQDEGRINLAFKPPDDPDVQGAERRYLGDGQSNLLHHVMTTTLTAIAQLLVAIVGLYIVRIQLSPDSLAYIGAHVVIAIVLIQLAVYSLPHIGEHLGIGHRAE